MRLAAGLQCVLLLCTFNIAAVSGLYIRNPPSQKDGNSPDPNGNADGLVFHPDNTPEEFVCDYSQLRERNSGWRSCFGPENRSCWLTNDDDIFDINTDYEAVAPPGVLRQYTLDVADMTLSPDGYRNTGGKAVNGMYPGPRINACWGDEIEITVVNHLKWNGTTIHWHGIRQLGTPDMDGVNGISQCPIAGSSSPDSFTYRFKATQYGTSWYHSHYALQYADGILGPISIFGPSSANYDVLLAPVLISDWNHVSAFSLFYQEITPHPPPQMTNILVNGIGHWPCTPDEVASNVCVDQPSYYNMTFTKGKSYAFTIVNTATDSTLIFSIDNHNLTVVSTDFVPIQPYVTDSVLIGIGQRYEIIVEANPTADDDPSHSNHAYWIRTVPAEGCTTFATPPPNNTGILFYDGSDQTVLPSTTMFNFSTKCADEPYESLVPILPWYVGPQANPKDDTGFFVGLEGPPSPGPYPPPGNFNHWEIGEQPLWLNFSNPTLKNVNQGKQDWPSQLVVVPYDVPAGSWVYMLITATAGPFAASPRKPIPASHPIHLHGHDFVILKQSQEQYREEDYHDLKLDNPPRRDVALLSSGGYLILAFRADNPGSWLLHCHIAWHASSGLALQVLERDGTPQNPQIPISNRDEMDRVCSNWNVWEANRNDWWDPSAPTIQDDSGI